jgi:hypothetical protein
LSGEGKDGSEGLEEIVRVGGGAIIQAPVSCLIQQYGFIGTKYVRSGSSGGGYGNSRRDIKFLPKLNF